MSKHIHALLDSKAEIYLSCSESGSAETIGHKLCIRSCARQQSRDLISVLQKA